MKYFFQFLLSFLILPFSFSADYSRFDIPFMQSMKDFYQGHKYEARLQFYKTNFDKTNFLKVMKEGGPNFKPIPKIIHQIWIGEKQLPEKLKVLMKSWKEKHPDWEYKLWSNQDLASFNPVSGRAISFAENIGSKVDIFKYEILYRYGGIYVDADFESIEPLDPIQENTKFFAGIYANSSIGNGIIGSVKEHPLLNEIVLHFRKRQIFKFRHPLKETGPKFFTKMIHRYLLRHPEDPVAIYPVSFFHPYPRLDRVKYWSENIPLEELRKLYTKKETFAIHYWAHSWR